MGYIVGIQRMYIMTNQFAVILNTRNLLETLISVKFSGHTQKTWWQFFAGERSTNHGDSMGYSWDIPSGKLTYLQKITIFNGKIHQRVVQELNITFCVSCKMGDTMGYPNLKMAFGSISWRDNADDPLDLGAQQQIFSKTHLQFINYLVMARCPTIYFSVHSIIHSYPYEQSRKPQIHGKDIHKFGKVPSLTTRLYNNDIW